MQYFSTGRKMKIIGLCTADLDAKICSDVKTAITSFKYAYPSVYFVEVPAGIFVKGNMGCMKHPNAKGQRLVAEAVYEQVKTIL